MAHLTRPTLAHRLLAAGASLGLALLLSGGVLFALRLPAAFAATTITVDSTADDLTVNGNCTLREALQAANTDAAVDACPAGSGADTISLPAGTFTLALTGAEEDANTTGDLDVLASVTIEGASAATSIVDADGLDRVFDVYSPAQVTFRHLTIRGGDAGSGFAGGGVFVNTGAVITVTESIVRDNQAGAEGGGIEAWGTVLIERSAILSNTTYDGTDNGGGIGILDGVVLVDNSTIAHNSAHAGGGVGILFGGAITVTNSTFAFNAYTDGGGDDLYLFSGEMVLRNSILAGVDNCWIGGTGLLTGDNNLITHATYCDDNGSSDGRLAAPTNLSAAVADNGGQTPTLALLAGSNALNAGTGSCLDHAGTPLATDQRGTARPQGAVCDLGAYERAVAPGITVDAFTDDLTNNGNCTLREAVKAANTNAAVDACAAGTTGLDLINLAAGTYTLSLSGAGENSNNTGDLDVTSATHIIGAGAATTIIDANSLDRALDVQGSGVFALDGVTVRNGYLTGASGAGLNVNTGSLLTLTSVIFTNNWVDSASNWDGGALWSNAAATVSDSQFISNTASNWGGGAYFGAATTITGSTFLSNTLARGSGVGNGGGAYLAAAAAITNTTFEGNSGQNLGGGLYLANAASSILNSTFVRNSAPVNGGGGILLLQGGSISGSTVMSNTAPTGAGSYSTNNTTTILNSTYFSNTASSRGGGAFLNAGTLTISGSTFISNSAGNLGGGGALFSAGGTIVNSTFQNNVSAGAGGGVSMANAASSIVNSYFLTNTAVFGGGANLTNGGVVTGSTFQSNTASSTAGGLNLQFNQPLWITNTNFISNTFSNTANSGGGLRGNGPVTITGGLFQGNSCPGTTCSGAAFAATQNTVISGTQFVNNTGAFGAAVVASGGSLTVSNATFQGNSGRGAPAINSFVPTVIDNSLFLSNTATHNTGGAVYVNNALTITGGRFEGNQALGASGGALDKGSTQNLSINGTQFLNNSSAFYGGAVSSYISASVYITNAQFLTNTAAFGGGALYVSGTSAVANVAVTGSLFQGNTGSGGSASGGAVHIDRPLSLLLAGNRFLGNASAYGGALTFWNLPAGSRVQNNLFAGNTSPLGNPGSVLHYGNGELNFEHNTVVSATAGSSAALYLVGGTANVTNTIVANYPTVFEVSFGATLNEDYNLFDGYTQIFAGAAGPFPAAHDRSGSQPFTADYHLAGAGEAVNTGLPGSVATDYDGEARPQGDGVDLGYDEVATASTAISGLALTSNSPQLSGDFVAFTATVATGTGLTYAWNFGDGSPVETNTYAELAYAYAAPGSYTAVVTATNTTNSASSTTSVTVLAPPSGPITVDTTADELNSDGDCSLREAIEAANTDAAVDACPAGDGPDTISLPAGTYTLALAGASEDANATGDLDVTDSLTITGASAATTLLDADGLDRALHAHGSALLTLQDLTVQNGAVTGYGGGVSANANLTLTDVTVMGNAATSGHGGGVYGAADVIVAGGTFTSNTVTGSGGGLYATGVARLSGAQLLNNTSGGNGAAVYGLGGAAIVDSRLQGNVAASGYGGGVHIAGGTLGITDTQIIENAAQFGGGVSYYNTSGGGRIVNVLLADNYAAGHGSGIYVQWASNLEVLHTTIASDSLAFGAGIYVDTGSDAVGITNTIITNYFVGIEQAAGTVFEDYNLIHDNLDDLEGAVISGGHSLGVSPQYQAQACRNYRLGGSSPAIDAGVDVGVTTDFEGDARPLLGGFDLGYDEAATTTPAVDLCNLTADNSSPAEVGAGVAFTATLGGGTDVSYDWDFGDGATGSGATDTHTYAAEGLYTAVVTATNTSSTLTATTTVEIINVSPVAEAGPDQTVEVDALVTLDGTGSTAAAGHEPLTYGWAQTGGPSVTLDDAAAAEPTFTAPATPAVLTFTLTVTDNLSLASAPDEVVITVADQAITGLGADNDGPTTLGQVTQFGTYVDTGTNIVYSWSFGDGATGAGATTNHTYTAAGNYTAVVTATNSTSTVTFTTPVEITNLAPYAGTNGNQTVDVSTTVYLDGSTSDDDDGHLPLTYGWAQTGGPAVTLNDADAAEASFSAPNTPAVLTFTLTVTDSTGLADATPAQVVITVQDEAISGLGANNDGPTTLGQSTSLSADYATGTHVTFAWSFGDGATGSGQYPSHTYSAAGSYTAVVTATNSTNVVTASTTVQVTNLAPLADAGSDQTVEVGDPVTLDGSGSNDPDGHDPLTYAWSQTGGPSVTLDDDTAAQPSFTAPSAPAVLTFTLDVTDSAGLADATPDTVVITVNDQAITGLTANNDSPTTLGQSTGFEALFDTGTNLVYSWSFGDGANDSGATTSHTYTAAGNYTAVVTATNGTGAVTATTAVEITNLAPYADAGGNQTVTVGETVYLDGSSSGDDDGHLPLTFGWAQTGGPAVTLSSSTSDQPDFTAPSTPTVLTFTLTVTDSTGLADSTPAQVVITVQDEAITGLAANNDGPTTLGNGTAFEASLGTGSNVLYSWNFGDGATGSGQYPSHTYGAVGSYTAVVTATNSSNTVTATTSVSITNLAPVADAGPDQTVNVGETVYLDGAGSDDPDDHDPLTYGWQQTGGPSVSLDDATAEQPSFTAPATPTVLTFTLTVTDSAGLVDATPDEVVITVQDEAITGLSAASSSPTTLGQSTAFTATATTGSNVAYAWDFGDGTLGAGATDTHTYAAVGSYTAVVTATNGTNTVTATTSVNVTNLAPVADAGPDQSVAVDALVTLDGTASADPDGHSPVTYGWEQTGGAAVTLSSLTAAQPTFTAPSTPGTLTFTLTVTDSTGLVDSTPDSVVISVGDAAVTGLSAANSSPTTLGQATAFTATIATGSNPAYTWDFGDGATGSGANDTHTYAAAGSYTAVVTATNSGGSVTATTSVTISNLAPVANAGPDQTVDVTDLVTLDGTASADGDGHTPLTYGWAQTGGPAVTLSSAAAAQPTFTAPSTPAVLTFTLAVTDSAGLPAGAPDSVVITVQDEAITGLTAANDGPTTLGHFTTFTATKTTGSNVAYAWDFGDGTTGSGATTDHIYGATGAYTAVVTATNSTSTVTATTSVSITNLAPVANAGSDQSVTVSTLVTLDGTASTDPDDHTPISYHWAQTGGPAVTLSNSASDQPDFTAPASPAVLTFTLTVTDTYDLAGAPDTVVITVQDEALTGLSAASSSPTTLTQATSFTATTSAGTNAAYAWDFGDGAAGSGATTTHTYAAVGSYTAVVTATNGANTVTATTSVNVTNLAPTANAGSDQSVDTSALVTLDGTASTDGDGHTPLTYGWAQTGGPAVTLSSSAAAQPTFTAPASPTVLTFTLTVTDSAGLADSTPDTVVITVTDAAITGLSAANSSPTTLGQPTALTATLSTGSGVSYAWNYGDGSTGAGATTTHTYAAVGSYTAVVTATNGGGSVTATTSVSITNLPPVADAGPDQTVIVSSLVTLNGTGSADPDGHTPLTRAWAQTGGPAVTLSSATAAQPTFTAPASPTVLTFTLTVTDSAGLVDGTPDSVVITVTNQAITGLAAVSTSPDDVGQTTYFTATVSAGTNVTYAWNYGDGTALGSGATTSHAYAVAGSYTATVTATNSLGSVVATTPVSLVAGQHTCTQAALTSAINAGGTGTVTLDGSCIYQLTSATFNSGSSGPSGYLLSNASVIEGNGAVIERAPGAPAFRLLYLNKAGLVVRNLTVRGGLASGAGAFAYGGGFLVNFNATLDNVRIENNQAGIGAGMFVNSGANITFTNSALISNTASSYGGGLYTSSNLALVLRNTQVANNTAANGPGGGLDTYASSVLLSNSTVTGNRTLANGGGGGLYTSSAASVVISGTVFRNNTAAGSGGAVQTFAANLSVVNSVFSGNLAASGGAGLHVSSSGSLSVLHSTFVDTARNPNPAIFVWGSARVTNTILSGYAQGLGTAGGSLYPVTEDYNLFANNGVDAQVIYNGANLTRGTHSVVAAGPGLVNPAAGDFHPVATSAALNAADATGPAADLDGLARPFGSAADIGAYEFQQAAVASLAVTKSGPPWVMPGAPLRYVLMVYNPSLVAADNLELVDLLPAGANYVGGSATGGGTLGGSTLTWNLGTLAARSSLRLEYVVTATTTLTHASYYVHSTTNALITATGASLVTPLNANIVASLGFFPNPDGYSFPNYGDSPDSDLTVDDMVFIYGADKVCKTTSPCVLTAAAEAWRLAWIDLVKGGHCAGMAMSSLLIFDRADVNPGDYQGGANVTFDLSKANIRRLIALYATTQTRTPVNRTGLTGNVTAYGASSVLNALIANFNAAAPADRYRMGFVKADGTGGHAVTPYAVEQRGADEYWIYVYDNNYPNNFDRVFKVTPSTNTWVYEGGATIPGAPVSAYRGDGTQLGNIVLQSLRWAERFPKVCDSACTSAAAADTAGLLGGVETDMLEFQLDGEGYLLITRSDGLRLGFDPVAGQYVYEIPGAEEVQVVTGIGLNAPPLYRVPATPGYTYSVQVSNRDNALGQLTATANVNILGPGYVLRLKNLQMNSAEATPVDSETSLSVAAAPSDTVSATFDPASRRVTFTTSALDGDTPSVYLALTNPDGSDYTFELSSLHLGAGTSLAMRYEAATGRLFVENDNSAVDTFDLYVQRLNLDGTVNTYTGTGLSDGDGVGVIAAVGDTWDGAGAPNVTTNHEPSLGVIRLYLPLVTR